jgi:hypothetical protein
MASTPFRPRHAQVHQRHVGPVMASRKSSTTCCPFDASATTFMSVLAVDQGHETQAQDQMVVPRPGPVSAAPRSQTRLLARAVLHGL